MRSPGTPRWRSFWRDFYYGRTDGVYEDNSTEAFRAYNCMDYPVENDPAAEAAAQERVEAKAPTIAPYWQGVDVCEVWPYPPTGVRERITADGAAPIVVVGTTNDPATPYEWSVSLAEQLSSGVLITREGEGHTGYNKGDDCVDAAVEAYLLEGTVPEDGLVLQRLSGRGSRHVMRPCKIDDRACVSRARATLAQTAERFTRNE